MASTDTLVVGTNNVNDTLDTSGGGNTKYDGKGGNDVIKGQNTDDIIIGGQGSDYLFGGLGKDTFEFSKIANAGDHDYIVDFNNGLGDVLRVFNGATIVSANAAQLDIATFNGQSLANDSRVYDVTLTLHVVDGPREFDYQVTLMDVIKNTGFSADQFNSYLQSIGYNGGITFAGDTPAA